MSTIKNYLNVAPKLGSKFDQNIFVKNGQFLIKISATKKFGHKFKGTIHVLKSNFSFENYKKNSEFTNPGTKRISGIFFVYEIVWIFWNFFEQTCLCKSSTSEWWISWSSVVCFIPSSITFSNIEICSSSFSRSYSTFSLKKILKFWNSIFWRKIEEISYFREKFKPINKNKLFVFFKP